MKFHEAERRALRALGVPSQMLHYWEGGGGIGKKYARIVAQVTGKTLEEILFGEVSEGEAKQGKTA